MIRNVKLTILILLSCSFFNNAIVALDKKREREQVIAKKSVADVDMGQAVGVKETNLDALFERIELAKKAAMATVGQTRVAGDSLLYMREAALEKAIAKALATSNELRLAREKVIAEERVASNQSRFAKFNAKYEKAFNLCIKCELPGDCICKKA